MRLNSRQPWLAESALVAVRSVPTLAGGLDLPDRLHKRYTGRRRRIADCCRSRSGLAMDERTSVKGQGRLAAAARHLGDQALDGVIAASNGLNNFLESNAVYVLSGVRPIGESAVVLDRDGRSTLVVTPAWDETRAAAISSTDRTIGTDDLAATLKSVAGAHRLDLSRTISVGLSLLGAALVER